MRPITLLLLLLLFRLMATAQPAGVSPGVPVQSAGSSWPINPRVSTVVGELLPKLTTTAFVFCINQRISANSNAHVVRETLGDIRARLPGTPIHFVFDSLLSREYARRYLSEVMFWPLSNREAELFIHINQNTFDVLLDGRLLSSITYLERGKIVFSQPVKHTSLKRFSFKYQPLEIVDSSEVSLPTSVLLPTPLDQVFIYRGNILYLSDYQNTLFLLDAATGNVLHRLMWEQVEAVELYANYVRPSRSDIRYARQEKGYLMQHHRQDKPIYQVFIDGDAIWISFGIQIMEHTKSDASLSNGRGGTFVVPKGQPIGSSYAMLAKLDTALRPVLFNYVPDLPPKLADRMMASPDVSFAVRGEALSVITNPSGVVGETNAVPAGVTFWLTGKKKARFISPVRVPWPAGAERLDREETEGKFINGDDIALQRETEPIIYQAYTGKPLARLRMPTGTDSTTIDSLQASWWFQLANGSLTPNSIGVVFRKNEQVVCNVFTDKFSYLQAINLTSRLRNTSSVAVGNLGVMALLPHNGGYTLRRYYLGPSEASTTPRVSH